MKTLILYATHHGTTAKVAQRIAQQLPIEETVVLNIKESKRIDLSAYDQIIIGSSIHAGHNQRAMQQFCKKHLPDLLQKRIGLFLCCLNEKEFEQSRQNAYPELLRKQAFAFELAGGEYLLQEMNFIERFLVKKIAGVTETKSLLNEEGIERFINKCELRVKI